MRTFKPDYKDPKITTTGKPDGDNVAISKEHLKKIQTSLDEYIQNGWTLVYYDKFLNTLVVTNGGNEVTKFDYAVTKVIQQTIFNLMKDIK